VYWRGRATLARLETRMREQSTRWMRGKRAGGVVAGGDGFRTSVPSVAAQEKSFAAADERSFVHITVMYLCYIYICRYFHDSHPHRTALTFAPHFPHPQSLPFGVPRRVWRRSRTRSSPRSFPRFAVTRRRSGLTLGSHSVACRSRSPRMACACAEGLLVS
jgi:hypothetical protein